MLVLVIQARSLRRVVSFDRKTVNKYLKIYQKASAKWMEALPPLVKLVGGDEIEVQIDDARMIRGRRRNTNNNSSGNGEMEPTYLGFVEKARANGERGKAIIIEIPDRRNATIAAQIERSVMPG